MSINPNLRNPLSLFAICFLIVESIFTTLFMWRIESITLCPCMIKMLLIFIIAFPVLVFICFYVLLWRKPEVLYSPYENAIANYITNKMTKQEKQSNDKAKAERYGISASSSTKDNDGSDKKSQTKISFSEGAILDKYIAECASFLNKDVKVTNHNIIRYFDAYSYWNGCHYVVEVKRICKWTELSLNGVRLFASSAKSYFSPLHMTFILQITDTSTNRVKIAKEIHEIDPAINIVFAEEENGDVKLSNIY